MTTAEAKTLKKGDRIRLIREPSWHVSTFKKGLVYTVGEVIDHSKCGEVWINTVKFKVSLVDPTAHGGLQSLQFNHLDVEKVEEVR